MLKQEHSQRDAEADQQWALDRIPFLISWSAKITIIPETLRGAADFWLAVRRAEMAKDSYRVVPSKIKRFLQAMNDVQTDRMNAAIWGFWVRSLRMDVREGKLHFQTARIPYSRSREFLRWLIDHGKMSAFPVLDASAEKALKKPANLKKHK